MFIGKPNILRRCEHVRFALVVVMRSVFDCFEQSFWVSAYRPFIGHFLVRGSRSQFVIKIFSLCAHLMGGLVLSISPSHK